MAANEPVTSPDQHKPGPKRAARVGAITTVIALIMMAFCAGAGRQESATSLVVLLVTAALIVGYLLLDWILRRNGLRS